MTLLAVSQLEVLKVLLVPMENSAVLVLLEIPGYVEEPGVRF